MMDAEKGEHTFQLTPSRRATGNISLCQRLQHISTHALTEGDILHPLASCQPFAFQLTPSRRATIRVEIIHVTRIISTHALTEGDRCADITSNGTGISTHALTEGDSIFLMHRLLIMHFNSRPHGGRPGICERTGNASAFQLTPSRRATPLRKRMSFLTAFQLTPSRRATQCPPHIYQTVQHFNSRHHGGRLDSLRYATSPIYFNSRPHGGRRQI